MEENAIRKRDVIIPIILIFIVFSGLFHLTHQESRSEIPEISSELQEPTVLTVEVLDNQSMGWFRSRIVLNITTDVPINMSYYLSGIGVNAEKLPEINSSTIVISNLSSQIEIFIQPQWAVFPSSFQYQLILYYINTTTQIPQNIFEISSGTFNIILGVPLSIIIGSVLILGIIVVAIRPVRLRKYKESSSSETQIISLETAETTIPSSSFSQASPELKLEVGKIHCPECNKKIAEGSAFCPECGYHIPRFLRTKE